MAGAAELRGTVTIDGLGLPGATVSVFGGGDVRLLRVVSGADGRFEAAALPAGRLRVEARVEGLGAAVATVDLVDGGTHEVVLEIPRARTETLDVTEAIRADSLATTFGPRQELQGQALENLPAGGGTVDDALATLPGVVRPRDALSIRGGRPGQSGLLLGSMALADPATGEARLRVPVDAVASVEVLSNPLAAEFGRFSSGLVLMQPRAGAETWRSKLSSIDPAFRRERGHPLHVLGLRSFGPRLSLSGPLAARRLYLAQSVQYRYNESDLESRPQDETSRQQSLSVVTRLDLQASARHRLRLLMSLFPERRERVNLATFVPPEATYGQRNTTSSLSLSHTGVIGSSAVLETSLHASRHRLWLTPEEAGTAWLQPQGASGGYFNRQERSGETMQLVQTLSFAGHGRLGEHVTLLGIDALHATIDGESESLPVEIRRQDRTLARRVAFSAPGRQLLGSTDFAAFARTRWRPLAPLTVELGARLDRDGVTGRSLLAPRLGAAWRGLDERLRLRAGVGLFAERTPSLVGAFGQIEAREETRYAEDGSTVLGATRYAHATAPGLSPARSTIWSSDVSYRPAPSLELRLGALRRDGRHEAIVDAIGEGDEGRLVLDSRGISRYREVELGLRFTPRPKAEGSLSWVHSRSEADLNSFVDLFGTVRAPVVRPSEYGLSSYDVPDRMVLRAAAEVGRWYLTGMLEARQGTPWSAVDEDLEFVGPRNASGRLPGAVLIDLAVERRLRVRRWQPWIGVGVVNLLGQFAARDVQANVTAPDYGTFYNPMPRRLRLFVTLSR